MVGATLRFILFGAGQLTRTRQMKISTRNLEGLPDVARLKRLLQSMAMLDAILMPEWEHRDYFFEAMSLLGHKQAC
jgi:hypothetical protein